MACRQANFHALDFPDQSVANDFRAVMEILFGPLPRTRLPDEVEFLYRLHDGLLLDNGARQRLFAVDVLTVFRRLDRDQGMPMVRHSEHDGINVLARHHLAIIMIRFAVLVLVMAVDRVEGGLQVLLVNVASGHNLAVRVAEEGPGVAWPLHPPTDDAHRDAIGRRRRATAAQGAGWDDGGRGGGHAGERDKMPAGDFGSARSRFH